MNPGEPLLDHLQAQGYEPQDDSPGRALWADLTASGVGTVRAVINPEDDTAVIYFDRFMSVEWQVKFSPDVPDAVILGAIVAAEWELAIRRGGPVTPAQAEAAR